MKSRFSGCDPQATVKSPWQAMLFAVGLVCAFVMWLCFEDAFDLVRDTLIEHFGAPHFVAVAILMVVLLAFAEFAREQVKENFRGAFGFHLGELPGLLARRLNTWWHKRKNGASE